MTRSRPALRFMDIVVMLLVGILCSVKQLRFVLVLANWLFGRPFFMAMTCGVILCWQRICVRLSWVPSIGDGPLPHRVVLRIMTVLAVRWLLMPLLSMIWNFVHIGVRNVVVRFSSTTIMRNLMKWDSPDMFTECICVGAWSLRMGVDTI